MIRWPVLTCVSLTLLSCAGDRLQVSADKPTWHSDYPQALAEAKRTGKPLFVVFRCQP